MQLECSATNADSIADSPCLGTQMSYPANHQDNGIFVQDFHFQLLIVDYDRALPF